MARLSPQQKKFLSFLAGHSEGDVVSKAEIVNASGWSESTVRTYFGKNVMDPFLKSAGADGTYIVRRSGDTISREEFALALTQRRSDDSPPTRSEMLQGEHSRYALENIIGRGAVAQVWSATTNGEQRAVKIMDPRPDFLDPSMLANVRQRFVRESRNGMRLRHDHVVRYRDVGETGSRPFLVMDRAERSLKSRLKTGKMNLRESLRVVKCCLSGLKYIHGEGCVHRDVKPGNILKIGNQWVLGDLGIVRWSDMNKEFTTTRSSEHLGSWPYMAPEQHEDPHNVDARSDVFSLGITWYEMLAGKVPSPAAVGAKEFELPAKIDVVDKLITKMIEIHVKERPTVADIIRRVVGFEKSRLG